VDLALNSYLGHFKKILDWLIDWLKYKYKYKYIQPQVAHYQRFLITDQFVTVYCQSKLINQNTNEIIYIAVSVWKQDKKVKNTHMLFGSNIKILLAKNTWSQVQVQVSRTSLVEIAMTLS